jgi:beta-galactosidase/beta-glucuronidase
MDAILKESAEARSFSIALEGHNLSGDLIKQLNEHSKQLEKAYRLMQTWTLAKQVPIHLWERLSRTLENKHQWYLERHTIAKSMLAAVNPKKKTGKNKGQHKCSKQQKQSNSNISARCVPNNNSVEHQHQQHQHRQESQ